MTLSLGMILGWKWSAIHPSVYKDMILIHSPDGLVHALSEEPVRPYGQGIYQAILILLKVFLEDAPPLNPR